MLLNRLFNWIKFKTLPPSVLFNNRLFVERDSKHRRVTSNLGLTFRNSKWTSYSRTNINLNTQSLYLTSVLKLLATILLALALFSAPFLYSTTYVYANSVSTLWFLFDMTVYLKVALITLWVSSTQILFPLLSNRLFAVPAPRSTQQGGPNSASEGFYLPRRLHKPLFYSWLITQSHDSSLEHLFGSQATTQAVETSLPAFHEMFKSAFYLSKLTPTCAVSYGSVDSLTSPSYLSQRAAAQMFSLGGLSQQELSVAADFWFTSSLPRPVKASNELTMWSLNSLHAELAQNSEYTNFKKGLFYSLNMSYSDLNKLSLGIKHLDNLKNSIDNQISIIRWQRWLYKYNLLHRSVLRSSSNLTFSKKLLSNGFYSPSLFNKNIWASSSLASGKLTTDSVNAATKALYGDYNHTFMHSNNFLTQSFNFLNSSQIGSLSFYEDSYSWFIKRFYLLNSLKTNRVVLLPVSLNEFGAYLASASTAFSDSTFRISSGLDASMAFSTGTVLDSLSELPYTTSDLSTDTQTSNMPTLHLSYYDYTLWDKPMLNFLINTYDNTVAAKYYYYTPKQL